MEYVCHISHVSLGVNINSKPGRPTVRLYSTITSHVTMLNLRSIEPKNY